MDEDLKDVLWGITVMGIAFIVGVAVITIINNLSSHYALERCIKAKEAGLNLEECKGE